MYMNFKKDKEPLLNPVYVQALTARSVHKHLDALAKERGMASSAVARQCIYQWSDRRYIAKKHTRCPRECYINVRMSEKQKRTLVKAATHAGESTTYFLGSVISHGLTLI